MLRFDSEKCLEDFVHGHFLEHNECLIDKAKYEFCGRQVSLDKYGTIDLLFGNYVDHGTEEDPKEIVYTIHAVELKNEQISTAHIGQIARYKTAIEETFEAVSSALISVELKCSLVVPQGMSLKEDCCYLSNHLNGIDVYEFILDPHDGISFHLKGPWSKSSSDPRKVLRAISGLAGGEE